jgi:hypothetical protein
VSGVHARVAQPQPALEVLRAQGRSVAWLARTVGRRVRGRPYDRSWLSQVLHGWAVAPPALRAACAAELGVPESLLFHADTSERDAA